jgi:hypothetical protein
VKTEPPLDTTSKIEQLENASRRRAEDLLNAAHVWKIGSYGWLNAADADPEFIGHAMWQTEPAISHDYLWTAARNNAPKERPQPEDWKRVVAIAGADFEGLMDAARMSIGLFLLQEELMRERKFHDDSFLDLHRTSAVIYLAMASERLREFFIAAVFRKPQRGYDTDGKYAGRKRSLFTTPFVEGKERLRTLPHLAENLLKLEAIAGEIRGLRKTRNALVHELATSIGLRERNLIDDPPEAAEPSEIDFSKIKQAVKAAKVEREHGIVQLIEQLAGWNHLLARAANEIFIVERALR